MNLSSVFRRCLVHHLRPNWSLIIDRVPLSPGFVLTAIIETDSVPTLNLLEADQLREQLMKVTAELNHLACTLEDLDEHLRRQFSWAQRRRHHGYCLGQVSLVVRLVTLDDRVAAQLGVGLWLVPALSNLISNQGQ